MIYYFANTAQPHWIFERNYHLLNLHPPINLVMKVTEYGFTPAIIDFVILIYLFWLQMSNNEAYFNRFEKGAVIYLFISSL